MKSFKNILLALGALAVLIGLAACQPAEQSGAKKIKAGFIYVGPVGDYGFSNAHDVARKAVEAKYQDWLTTTFVESVPEGDAMRYIDRLVNEEKCNVIFTNSFGYMDTTIEAAKKYPDVTFMHCSGFKQEKNAGTFFAELGEMYYLNGLMAGALSKTGQAGYVGAFPIPEVVRHINAFALGVKAANPKATVSVRWINSWYDPAKAKEAAEALVAEGCDVLAFTEDSPTVIEVAQAHTKAGKQVYAFAHYSPMQQYGEDAVVSGELVNWTVMYDKILTDIHDGKWTNADMFWAAKEGAALLGGNLTDAVNPKFAGALKAVTIKGTDLGDLNAYDLVMQRYEAIKAGSFNYATGPIKAQDGTEKYAAGIAMPLADLLSVNWFVDNVKGEVPAN